MGCVVSTIIGVTASLVRRYGDVLLAYGKSPYQSTSTSLETLPVSNMLYYCESVRSGLLGLLPRNPLVLKQLNPVGPRFAIRLGATHNCPRYSSSGAQLSDCHPDKLDTDTEMKGLINLLLGAAIGRGSVIASTPPTSPSRLLPCGSSTPGAHGPEHCAAHDPEHCADFGDLLPASTPDKGVPLANTAHPVSPSTGASVPHLYTQETLPVNAATAKPDMNGKSEAEILAWKMYPEAMSKGCRALNLGRAKSGLAGKTMSWREIKLESSYMASTSDSTPSVLPPDRKAVNLERTRSRLRSEIPALMDINIDPAIKIAADELTSMQLHRVHAAPAGTRGLHHARSLPGPSNSFSSVRTVAPSSIPLTGKWRRGRCSPCSGTCPPPSLERGCCLCYRGINGWL